MHHFLPLDQSEDHEHERGSPASKRANDTDQDRSHLDKGVHEEPNIAIVAPARDAGADQLDISNETPAFVGLDDKTPRDSQKTSDSENQSTGSQLVIAREINSGSLNEHYEGQTKVQGANVESEDEENDMAQGGQMEFKEKGKGNAGANPGSMSVKKDEDILEVVTLGYAKYKPTMNATEDELAEERRRILADPKTCHRLVFFSYSCDHAFQNGIRPENMSDKMAPNGIHLWGETLFNFYFLFIAGFEKILTVTSANKMLEWAEMHDNPENPSTKHLIHIAKREKGPKLIEPWDIHPLIIGQEAARRDACFLMRKRGEESEMMFPRTYPIDSIFTADTYPKGWARKPFSESFVVPVSKPPTLQQYIPQHLLPQKLVVHDPCNLLFANKYRRERQPHDITHSYKLCLSTTHTDRREADERDQVEQEATEKAIRDKFLADPHSRNTLPDGLVLTRGDKAEPGPVRPYVYYMFPPSVKPQQVKEAHVYLDMDHTLGSGHHSFVYSAVLELPRTFLVRLEPCPICIGKDIDEQLNTILNPDGSSVDPKFNEKTGKLVSEELVEELIVPSGDDTGLGCEEQELVYEGPYIALQSRVQYQNPEEGPYCEHRRKNEIHPLTTRVSVAAKVSIKGDHHLPREAQNYQCFPRHFFEHWSGYNIIPPMYHPVPLGPLVPQFYGYYDSELNENAERAPFESHLSPILLLEDCGTQIHPEELCGDDKNECASLLYRFNHSMWAHRSIFCRNILVQKGPIFERPVERMISPWLDGKKTQSFRLIDFGRSVYANDLDSEEREDVFQDEEKEIDNWYFDGEYPQ